MCVHQQEHFYDHQSGSSYLAWRLKTVQRNSPQGIKKSKATFQGGCLLWLQVGMYVCSGVENEMPLFKRIDCIIVCDDKAYLLTCEVSTMYFDEHLSAFCVEERTDVFQVISVYDLVYNRPHDRQFSYHTDDDHMYIVPYCYFV